MNRNLTVQLVSAAALVVICLFLINPLHAWMPDNSQEMMLAGAAVVFGILAGFVFSERGGDEREDSHRAFAGRAALFAGGLVLIIAIIVEGLQAMPDPWLVYALTAMVITKVAARVYATKYW